jgi:hypothetical protein
MKVEITSRISSTWTLPTKEQIPEVCGDIAHFISGEQVRGDYYHLYSFQTNGDLWGVNYER